MSEPTQAQIEAAEHGIKCLLSAEDGMPSWTEIARAALTAGAEVDDADKQFAKYGPTGMEDIEADIIERCAQVAANWEHDHYGTGKGIAAAIRALKTGKNHA